MALYKLFKNFVHLTLPLFYSRIIRQSDRNEGICRIGSTWNWEELKISNKVLLIEMLE